MVELEEDLVKLYNEIDEKNKIIENLENPINEEEQKIIDYIKKSFDYSKQNDYYLDIIKTIKKLDDKLCLFLYITNPLRQDYKKIYRNPVDEGNYYQNGKIIIPKANKVNRRFEIELPDYLIQEIEKSNNEFLINKKYFNDYFGRITRKYFGKSMKVNDFRHLRDFPPFIKEIYNILNEEALKINHELKQQIKNY